MAGAWEDAIAEREAQLGIETVRRMAEIFVADADVQLRTIQGALAHQDPAAARLPAHDLVNNAGTLCFEALAAAARSLEQACIARDGARALTNAAPLAPLVQGSTRLLKARYGLP